MSDSFLLNGEPAPASASGKELAVMVEATLAKVPRDAKISTMKQFHPAIQERILANKAFAQRVLQISQKNASTLMKSASFAAFCAELEKKRAFRAEKPDLNSNHLVVAQRQFDAMLYREQKEAEVCWWNGVRFRPSDLDTMDAAQLEAFAKRLKIHIDHDICVDANTDQIRKMIRKTIEMLRDHGGIV